MHFFKSERIEYWRPTAKEEDVFCRLYTSPNMMRHLGGALTEDQSRARFQKWLAHWEEHGFGPFINRLIATQEVIGSTGLFESSIYDESVIELGWAIFPEYQRQGYAFEGARRMLAYAREKFPDRPVIALPEHRNPPSNRICEKLGMSLRDVHDHPWVEGKVLKSAYWRID